MRLALLLLVRLVVPTSGLDKATGGGALVDHLNELKRGLDAGSLSKDQFQKAKTEVLQDLARFDTARPGGSTPQLHHHFAESAATPSAASKNLAIFTVALNKEGKDMCGLVKWCQQADRLAKVIPGSEVLIVSDQDRLEDCPHARIIPQDPEMTRLVSKYVDNHNKDLPGLGQNPMFGPEFNKQTMAKLQALSLKDFKAVFVADWDVDLFPPAQAKQAEAAWKKHLPEFLDSKYNLLASADNDAAVNAGVWLTKPGSGAWDIYMDFLRRAEKAEPGTRMWSREKGFDHLGSPKELVPADGKKHGWENTVMWKWDTWKEVGGGTDQGMLFWLFQIKLKGTYLPASKTDFRVRHWWGPGKPWQYGKGSPSFTRQWHYYEDLDLEIDGGPRTTCQKKLAAMKKALIEKRKAPGYVEPMGRHKNNQLVFSFLQVF